MKSLSDWIMAAVVGAFLAFAITLLAAWVGGMIEDRFEQERLAAVAAGESMPVRPLVSYFSTLLYVIFANAGLGALTGLIGAFTKRLFVGLPIGIVLHAIVFGGIAFGVPFFREAPPTVRFWVLTVGVVGGALAGAAGGLIGGMSAKKKAVPAPAH